MWAAGGTGQGPGSLGEMQHIKAGWGQEQGCPRVAEECQGAAGRGGAEGSSSAEEGAGAAAQPDRPRRAGAEGAALSGPLRTARGSVRSRAGLGSSAYRDVTPRVPSPRPPGASAAQPGATPGPSRRCPRLRLRSSGGGAGDGATRRGKALRGAGMEPSGRPALEKKCCLGAPEAVPCLGGPRGA